MPVISARIHHSLCAKAINHGVQKGWNAAQGDIYLFAREHAKVALSKGFQVQRSKDLFAFSGYIHQHNILKPIDSKSLDALLLIHIGQEVVVAIIDQKLVRTDHILGFSLNRLIYIANIMS